jgi:hypothetical protein
MVTNGLVPRITMAPARGSDLSRIGSTTPSAAKTSIDRGWQPSARDSLVDVVRRSMSRHRTPLTVDRQHKGADQARWTSPDDEYRMSIHIRTDW